jgi:Pentapeptide repeats (8 copies)
MNRQPPRRSVLHMLLSALTRKVPEQAKQYIQLPQCPAPDDRDAWRTYWEAQGQPWRTEPEIDEQRKRRLEACRSIQPDSERGIYPFGGMKLDRADVEWLLATHENGQGPVDWSDESQGRRKGLNLRGADLRHVDLERLPLTAIQGGLSLDDWFQATTEQRDAAAVLLDGAHLGLAHLENARLRGASLKGADFRNAYLHEAILNYAHLAGASFHFTHLESTHLEDAILSDKDYEGPHMADARWGNVNLSVVKWTQLDILGDEYKARQKKQDGKVKDHATRLKEYEAAVRANRQLAVALQAQGLNEDAARFSYRAQVLQKRVWWFQMTQRNIKLRQRVQALGAWLFSWFLFLLAGYGYRLWRSFLAYLLIISLFMTIYHVLDARLAWNEAFVLSMTAFHGRGFSPSTFTPGDSLSFASTAEAFVGLIIEVTFIATLTRRFFGQ